MNEAYFFLSTISIDQHGFFPDSSTATSFVDFISFLYVDFELGYQVYVINTYFFKAFNYIDQSSLFMFLTG